MQCSFSIKKSLARSSLLVKKAWYTKRSKTRVIKKPIKATAVFDPAKLPIYIGKIRLPAPKNKPNSMLDIRSVCLKLRFCHVFSFIISSFPRCRFSMCFFKYILLFSFRQSKSGIKKLHNFLIFLTNGDLYVMITLNNT